MRLYLDDCLDSDALIAHLTNAGHDVVSPRSVGASGQLDPDHLAFAAHQCLPLLTKNPSDFRILHSTWMAQGRAHAGILIVCLDNIKWKDMRAHDIVRALGNLLASGVPIANEIHILNHWR
jgi:predicted nuclease of predicted toxin-antitoxin system